MSETQPAAAGDELLAPTVRHRTQWQAFVRNFTRNRLSIVGGLIILFYIVVAVFAPLLAPHDPVMMFDATSGMRNPLPPGSVGADGQYFLLGTDKFGRDILSRSIYGARTLLQLSFGAVTIALVLGVFMGAVAGYNEGSWVDEALMRLVDVMLSFPTLVLAIALLGIFGMSAIQIGPFEISNMIKIMIVVAVTYAPQFARVMRGVVLQEMAQDYVDAAVVTGASGPRILIREVFVNTIPPIMVQASLMVGTTVLVSASLSFLGLGMQPPTPALGIMLNQARNYLFLGAWWYSLVPGVLISLAILGFNLLGDGLRDALDPRQARQV